LGDGVGAAVFFANFFDSGAVCDITNDDGSPLPPFGPLTVNNETTARGGVI